MSVDPGKYQECDHMAPLALKFENISEYRWRVIILAVTGSVILISLWCFFSGFTTVFPNLFYFPVILLAFRYHKNGVWYSGLLGLLYLVMALYFHYTNFLEIIGALLRFVSFIAVAVVIAYLSVILEKKQQAYRSLSEFRESIISNANVWLAVLDTKGNIIVWNKAAETMSGYTAGEVLGKNSVWRQIYPDADYRKKITGTIHAITRSNRFFENFDTVIQAKTGEKKTISWNTRAIPDESGTLTWYVAIGTDITERRRAENALAESEQKFRRIFDTSKDGLLLLDKDTGKISRVNPAIMEMLGRSAGQIVGKSLEEIGLLKDTRGLQNIWEKLDESGFVFLADVPLESRDGRLFDTEVYLVDRAAQVQCNIRDVTRRKQAEKGLIRRNEELRAANERLAETEEELRYNFDELFRSQQALEIARRKLSMLNSIVFTDIQNAIFSLTGYFNLEKELPGEEKMSQYLEKQIGIVGRVRESLQFASQYQNLGLKPPVWQDVTQVFLYGISHLDLSKISRKLDVEGLEIYADPLLENVFFTFAENVLLHGKSATEIALWYRETAGVLKLVFEDNGEGISHDMKEKIFERRYEEKRGLGLFLAREILAVTGMTIRETGEPGKGARFEILVPKESWRRSPALRENTPAPSSS